LFILFVFVEHNYVQNHSHRVILFLSAVYLPAIYVISSASAAGSHVFSIYLYSFRLWMISVLRKLVCDFSRVSVLVCLDLFLED